MPQRRLSRWPRLRRPPPAAQDGVIAREGRRRPTNCRAVDVSCLTQVIMTDSALHFLLGYGDHPTPNRMDYLTHGCKSIPQITLRTGIRVDGTAIRKRNLPGSLIPLWASANCLSVPARAQSSSGAPVSDSPGHGARSPGALAVFPRFLLPSDRSRPDSLHGQSLRRCAGRSRRSMASAAGDLTSRVSCDDQSRRQFQILLANLRFGSTILAFFG